MGNQDPASSGRPKDPTDQGRPLRSTLGPWATLLLVGSSYLAYGASRLTVEVQVLELVFTLLALTLLAAGLVSFVTLAVTRRHGWPNTLGLVLAIFPVPIFTVPDLGATEETRQSVCANNLKQVGSACLLYAKDHEGSFPAEPALLLGEHLEDGQPFVCPSRLEQLKAIRGGADLRSLPEARSYVYVAGLRRDDPAEYVLAFDEEWNHYGTRVNVLRVDGSAGAKTKAGALQADLDGQAAALKTKGREMKVVRPAWSRHPDAPEGYFTPWTVRPLLLTFLVMAAVCALAVAVELVVAYLYRRRAGSAEGQ